MTTLRKSLWALALAFPMASGCSTEEAPPETLTVPAVGGAAASPEPVTPLDKAEIKAEPPVAAPEVAAPAVEAPKAEAPAVEAPKVEAPPAEVPKAEAPKVEAPKGASAAKLNDEQIAEIKKLPEAEQVLALKQAVCPVSDEALGSMGVPIKVMAEGTAVYVCCKGCSKDVEADPKAVLAKLSAAK